jgi:hypothetical protein
MYIVQTLNQVQAAVLLKLGDPILSSLNMEIEKLTFVFLLYFYKCFCKLKLAHIKGLKNGKVPRLILQKTNTKARYYGH